ncbi:tRNA (adenosine(37)-N6)-threonylcarbamoyltransferase complex dimerization subunit type 1 TsaB [Amycolatopsis sp. 195334CR]|uniref:tRNA (adenosine(37)-N6)-threonylcarbamoyltransferase complex dimerization subunit type 1 TsaB n=1 Tax=Amycolatopsis sp. 195334CR TaxID=2814588 RepID=UPI001A8F3D63|nr:tRNA (adenosine(37)-N6)-threonylcarbamoyltransferase complex dimerization subunit type 1 TsaB [Amycolatopsis sp. 195334CR]MBN6036411.1 tRNA (adenosine(37)-N6)-threonylcarbamoyltransferase complex dimerization subunit type 1 TsaB [Amycolatopsis sp. 195334CR]
MLVLAVDTSTPAVTAGVVQLEPDSLALAAERVTIDARAHGELLTPHVLDAVQAAGAHLRDLGAIVCGAGPGPFTGLRAGMATAAALGHSLGIPVHPVCSLDAIAAEVTPGEPFLVVTDARRREVYWAEYDVDGKRVGEPAVQSPAELVTTAKAAAGYFAEKTGLRILEPEYPSPLGLVMAAREALRSGAEPAPMTPLYLRRPDAVEPTARKRVTTP